MRQWPHRNHAQTLNSPINPLCSQEPQGKVKQAWELLRTNLYNLIPVLSCIWQVVPMPHLPNTFNLDKINTPTIFNLCILVFLQRSKKKHTHLHVQNIGQTHGSDRLASTACILHVASTGLCMQRKPEGKMSHTWSSHHLFIPKVESRFTANYVTHGTDLLSAIWTHKFGREKNKSIPFCSKNLWKKNKKIHNQQFTSPCIQNHFVNIFNASRITVAFWFYMANIINTY